MGRAVTPLHTTAQALDWLRAQGVSQLTVDSRAVGGLAAQGVAFIAWPGAARDGRAFVAQALRDGARACLVEAEGLAGFDLGLSPDDADRVAAVPQLKAHSAEIAHSFNGEPSQQLQVVAVTGTNGKTSTSWWTAQALSAVGVPCGVIGTLGVGQVSSGSGSASAIMPTGLTTPDPVTLQATFRRFVDDGLQAAAIEASSIGIEEMRLHASRITVAQFTNFTQDHLDYHGSMDAYWQAKRALFAWPGLSAAVLNLDDPMGHALLDLVNSQGLSAWTYGVQSGARLQAQGIEPRADGLRFDVLERGLDAGAVLSQCKVHAPVVGDFNVSNLLAVLGALRALGVPLAQAAQACSGLQAVPGRMQWVAPAEATQVQPLVVVDYAHTPDALHKALDAMRPVAQARGGRLWCVFGCGGQRDPIKRPLMGAIASQHADQVVLTSDNPRQESPAFILSQILTGVHRTEAVDVIEDRRQAIVHAVTQAAPQDVILLAGKGHETDQDVAGVKTHFSDVEEAAAALAQRSPSSGSPA